MVNINLTLDGAANTITKGATITITDNATGEEIVKTWEGDRIQVLIAGMKEYTIKCSKITGYSSPKKVVFISSNDVTYDYSFNYITPPVGVYLLTTDDELIAPADWRSSYDCVGVYVGQSAGYGLYYTKVVLSPEMVICGITNVTSSNFSTIRNGMEGANYTEFPDNDSGLMSCVYKGPSNTRYMYENYGAFSGVWNYKFKNGAQAYVPSEQDLHWILLPNFNAIKAAYDALGVEFTFTATGTATSSWDVYMLSSTPGSYTNSSGNKRYGWVYGKDSDGVYKAGNNYTSTLAFSAY